MSVFGIETNARAGSAIFTSKGAPSLNAWGVPNVTVVSSTTISSAINDTFNNASNNSNALAQGYAFWLAISNDTIGFVTSAYISYVTGGGTDVAGGYPFIDFLSFSPTEGPPPGAPMSGPSWPSQFGFGSSWIPLGASSNEFPTIDYSSSSYPVASGYALTWTFTFPSTYTWPSLILSGITGCTYPVMLLNGLNNATNTLNDSAVYLPLYVFNATSGSPATVSSVLIKDVFSGAYQIGGNLAAYLNTASVGTIMNLYAVPLTNPNDSTSYNLSGKKLIAVGVYDGSSVPPGISGTNVAWTFPYGTMLNPQIVFGTFSTKFVCQIEFANFSADMSALTWRQHANTNCANFGGAWQSTDPDISSGTGIPPNTFSWSPLQTGTDGSGNPVPKPGCLNWNLPHFQPDTLSLGLIWMVFPRLITLLLLTILTLRL